MRTILRLCRLYVMGPPFALLLAPLVFTLMTLRWPEDDGVRWFAGIALGVAGVSPLVAIARVPIRIASHLPVTRHQIWRAWWLVSLGFPVLLALIAGIVGMFVWRAEQLVTSETLSLVIVLVVAAAALSAGLMSTLLSRGMREPQETKTHVVLSIVSVLIVPAFLAAAPVLLRDRLPLVWRDTGLGSLIFVGAAVLASIAFWRMTPVIHWRTVRRSSGARPSEALPLTSSSARRAWLTGTRRLIATEILTWTGIAALFMLLMMLLRIDIFGEYRAGESSSAVFVVMFVLIVEYKGARARQLRTLPLSTRMMAGLYTMQPIVFWLATIGLRLLLATLRPDIGLMTSTSIQRELLILGIGMPIRSLLLGRSDRSVISYVPKIGSLIALLVLTGFVDRVLTRSSLTEATILGVAVTVALAGALVAGVLDRRTILRRSVLYRVTRREAQPLAA